MKKQTKILMIFLSVIMLCSVVPATVFAVEGSYAGGLVGSTSSDEIMSQCSYTVSGGTYGTDYSYDAESKKLTLYSGVLTVTGVSEGSDNSFIEVAPDAVLDLTIQDISPFSPNGEPGLKFCAGSKVNLTLLENNVFCLGWDDIHGYSLYLDSDSEVTINGSGSLICQRNYGYGKLYLADSAQLIIKGGRVEFKGGQNSNSDRNPCTVYGSGKLVVDGGDVLIIDELRGTLFRNNTQVELKSGALELSYDGSFGNCLFTLSGGSLKSSQTKEYVFNNFQYAGGALDFADRICFNGKTNINADFTVPEGKVYILNASQTMTFAKGIDFVVDGTFTNKGTVEYYCQDSSIATIAGGKNQPYHIFDQKIAEDEHLSTPADCTNTATYYSSCLCRTNGTATFAYGDALGHSWGEPEWNWSEDGKSAKVTFTCENNSNHKETLNVADITSAEKNPAGCTENGTTTYTAKVTFNEDEYSSTKDIADLLPLGHNMQKINRIEPTCTTDGKEVYYTCENCGKHFLDAESQNEIENIDDYGVLKAIDHSFTVLEYNETEHWYKCENCGKTADAAEHTGGTATCTEQAVCEICNQFYGPSNGHSFTVLEYNETEHWYKCKNCDEITDIAEHTGGAATCTDKAVCKICNQPYGAVNGHSFGSAWNYDYESHWHMCHCGEKSELAAHTGITVNVKAATENETGYTGDVICSVCGYIIEKGQVIPALPVTTEESKTEEPSDTTESTDTTEPTETTDPTEVTTDVTDTSVSEDTTDLETTDTEFTTDNSVSEDIAATEESTTTLTEKQISSENITNANDNQSVSPETGSANNNLALPIGVAIVFCFGIIFAVWFISGKKSKQVNI